MDDALEHDVGDEDGRESGIHGAAAWPEPAGRAGPPCGPSGSPRTSPRGARQRNRTVPLVMPTAPAASRTVAPWPASSSRCSTSAVSKRPGRHHAPSIGKSRPASRSPCPANAELRCAARTAATSTIWSAIGTPGISGAKGVQLVTQTGGVRLQNSKLVNRAHAHFSSMLNSWIT